MVQPVVGDTYGTGQALGMQLLHGPPGFGPGPGVVAGGVDEIEVNVFKGELGERALTGHDDGCVAVAEMTRPEFGCDKNLRNACGGQY